MGDPFVSDGVSADGSADDVQQDAEQDGPEDADADGGAAADAGADVAADAPADAADAGPPTPCGSPRTEDAPKFTREVCFAESTFVMGSTSPNLGTGYMDHTPEHQVTLASYFLDAYEVTLGRYAACVAAGACPDLSEVDDCAYDVDEQIALTLPVFCANYATASAFCAWDERRLPTEAEWERAARGTQATAYPWGNVFSCEHAVLGSGAACKRAEKLPEPVGSRRAGASPELVFDLSGNVAEWVFDWAASYPNKPVKNPQGPSTGTWRIARGGSWISPPTHGVTFSRATTPAATTRFLGFRCARSAEQSE